MELIAEKRNVLGKAVRALRMQGLIPAELYGRGVKNEHLTVPAKEFVKVLKSAGENTLIQLHVGDDRHPVMIHDVAYHPVTDDVTAIDFYEVRLDEKIKVKVPLAFVGQAPAVKEKGGVLIKAVQELEVEALPASIPHTIDVDIQTLSDVGQSIYVKDVKLPEGVRVIIAPETVILSVVEKVSEEKEQQLAAQVDVTAIKAEVEEKKAERAAAAPEAKGGEGGATAPPPKK